MNSIVGFSLFYKLPAQKTETALTAQETALSYFKHLQHHSITIGESRLELWGHNNINDRIHYLPDGTLLALIGSELGEVSLMSVGDRILNIKNIEDFVLPWDGRVILLRVSADGRQWTMWNDWLGSLPVYHAEVRSGRLASTLEPIAVAGAGYDPNDFFLPGLVSLLINGHFISDWTLYKNMKIVPPDSMVVWSENGFQAKPLHTVQPSQNRWETGWDDLVDEMYELSRKAIVEQLKFHPRWVLPLSSGLDSRLIAGVVAETGANVLAYTWGGANTTDVNYSRQIARTLDIPWKHIVLNKDYLVESTPRWANLFGSAMPFHGMYQMSFFEALQSYSNAPIISGFFGDVISGDGIGDIMPAHVSRNGYEITTEWYLHWRADQLKAALKIPYVEAFEANRLEIKKMIEQLPGAFYQKMILLEAWNRQRLFTSFQTILKDYWCGVATPFMNREYAKFCFSLPRAVMDDRRLMVDVIRRYYGRLAVIPGTYAKEPIILTGKYLMLRRLAQRLLPAFHWGPLRGFGNVQLRMDIESVQAIGKSSLWPLFESWSSLSAWFDFEKLEQDYETIMNSTKDIQPLRRLQAVQMLAYRLTQTTGVK